MRVLITGGAGLLGSELIRRAPSAAEIHATWRTSPVTAVASSRVDLADGAAVLDLFRTCRPDVVIHTAYSTSDGPGDIIRATESIVAACAESGAGLVHMSTDALFDGEHAPYPESATPDPVHEYGAWKTAAEQHVRTTLPDAAIVRTSLVVRADPPDRASAWVVDTLRRGEEIRLFTDELRCPVSVDDLADQVWEVALRSPAERHGVWHLAGPEAISRYALGVLLAMRHGLDPTRITPATSRGMSPPRPRDLRLLTSRADAALRTRPRPISAVLAGPPVSGSG